MYFFRLSFGLRDVLSHYTACVTCPLQLAPQFLELRMQRWSLLLLWYLYIMHAFSEDLCAPLNQPVLPACAFIQLHDAERLDRMRGDMERNSIIVHRPKPHDPLNRTVMCLAVDGLYGDAMLSCRVC
ncbi:uncharacterized protein LAESUDRAFT_338596 [Laetiporus sulphureus 93-53]|uniref:Uncharacterized protein n=1 Tax=Laetiporus sulphureus 93-53 TaxID=1314785 RepID=A0A165GN90_9APHY|nr:uncharacterized protein LAESUDRAFT_338596 [Laetiporus sulphureus 93-53]KZT10580.1 hypothetical protein LAESUDRAFT_338596 [Laetiporus sulphureus 93-53]